MLKYMDELLNNFTTQTLTNAARLGTMGRVFISDLEAAQTLPSSVFRAWLLKAWRAGLLSLTRCDMPQLHDASTVSASEIKIGFAERHYVGY